MTQTASADHPKPGPNLPQRAFATPAKHSPKLSLIDNEKHLFRKIACRAGCLPAIKPAFSTQPRCRTTTQSTKSDPPNPAFSNRNFQQLEIAVTSTKHSPDPSSNRNFRSTNFHASKRRFRPQRGIAFCHAPFLIDNENQPFRKIACRAGCLPAINPALSKQPRCRTATQSTNSRPLVAHHAESQNIYPYLASTRTQTACAAGYLTNFAISNRNRIRLEIAVTFRKQKMHIRSNRFENTHPRLAIQAQGSTSFWSRSCLCRSFSFWGRLSPSALRGIPG